MYIETNNNEQIRDKMLKGNKTLSKGARFNLSCPWQPCACAPAPFSEGFL
jgi:hypothetical protein